MAGRVGRFWRVGPILRAFVALGCEVRVAEATIRLADGDLINARYLIRPSTGDFVALIDLEDDEQVSEAQVAFWEHRLGLIVPRPP